MCRGHLLERGLVDLVHLGMAAVFLAGLDLDRLRDTHAAGQNVTDQLEERQIERGFRMQRHRGPERHGALCLEVLGQRGRVGDFAGVRSLLRGRACRGAARALIFDGVFRADETHMERHLTIRPRGDYPGPRQVLGAVGLLQIAGFLFQGIHAVVKRVVGTVLEPLILHLQLQFLKLGGNLIDALLGSLIRLDRAGIDAAIVGHGRVVIAHHRIGPGKAQLYAGLFGRGTELLEQDGFDQRCILQHGMLFQKVSRNGAAPRLVVRAHEGPDIVADLHAAGFERLSDGIGLQIAAVFRERLEDLALRILARMLGEGLHRIERDHLAPGRGADVGMNEAVAQPAFHGRHRGAECLRDGLGRLAVDLHHPGKSLELIDCVHRRLGDVLGKRQRRGDIAIFRHEAAVHFGLRCEPLGGLVGDQLLQGCMASATSQHGVFAVELLDHERLQETQNGDACLQMGDVLRIIGFRGVAAHIGGVGDKIADGNGERGKACGHGISFQVGEVWPAPSRA